MELGVLGGMVADIGGTGPAPTPKVSAFAHICNPTKAVSPGQVVFNFNGHHGPKRSVEADEFGKLCVPGQIMEAAKIDDSPGYQAGFQKS